jgi:hypothetical protein
VVVASEAEAMPLARQVVAMDWAAQGSVARLASLASLAAMDWATAAMVLVALD